MKIIIGFLAPIDDDRILTLQHTYVSAIENAGGVPIILPYSENENTLESYVDMCDGFCFTGGVDIDPVHYGEPISDGCGKIQHYRDSLELKIFDLILKKKKPILGICRGSQVINVALGGTLYQDIPSEIKTNIQHRQSEAKDMHSHWINVYTGTPYYELVGKERILANSFHHQSVKALGKGLKVMATADDGVIEAFYYDGDSYIRAYQWHPERLCHKDENHRCIFNDFIIAVKEGKK